MIELNLTYEESKKILELGYDFSSVCATFSASGKTSSHGLPFATMITNPFLKEVGYLKNLNHLKSLPYMRLDKEINIDSITPIIPKAALEACLPREIELDDLDLLKYVMDSYESLSYSRILPSISGECLKYEVPKKGMFFNSAFEAFLWVHENHPEELKRKFDEVMG